MYFDITFQKVLMSLILIIPGYLALKGKLVDINHSKTLSSVLIYVCSPGLIINSFIAVDFSYEVLANMGWFFIITCITQIIFIVLLYLIFKKKFNEGKYRVMTIASVCSNMGYFAMPIVQSLFPNNPEVSAYTSVYVVTMNVIIFTIGVYFLTGKKEYMTVKKALLNPASLSFYVGMILFLLGAKNWLPKVATDCISSLGAVCNPLSMIILGIRLATIDFKRLFTSGMVYFVCALKLIAFPLFSYLLVVFLPVDEVFKVTLFVLSAAPVASSVLNFAELYGAEEDLSANVVMVSTLLSIVTIPILTFIL